MRGVQTAEGILRVLLVLQQQRKSRGENGQNETRKRCRWKRANSGRRRQQKERRNEEEEKGEEEMHHDHVNESK